MSALGQKQTLKHVRPMSALHPKADMDGYSPNVRFVPKVDSCSVENSPLAGLSFGYVRRHKLAAALQSDQLEGSFLTQLAHRSGGLSALL
jgi:hypothetical protein